MNEYYVRVTDGDGVYADGRIYINVVQNPDPQTRAQKRCTAPPPPFAKKPKFHIEVSGWYEKDETKSPKEYYFKPGAKATLTGVYMVNQHRLLVLLL